MSDDALWTSFDPLAYDTTSLTPWRTTHAAAAAANNTIGGADFGKGSE